MVAKRSLRWHVLLGFRRSQATAFITSVLRGLEIIAKMNGVGFRINSEHVQVEQLVQIGPQKQAISDIIRVCATVRHDMSRF